MLVGSLEATLLILLLVIVFAPIITERFRVPGIIGLIAGGMVFGPFVLGWLRSGGLVADLGAIGILYLMFLAGISFDIRAFIENRSSAIVYGLLGFVIPFFLTIAVVMTAFDITLLGAALIGAMWASNTLVAYPDVQAAGLQTNRAVSAAVSAGVVADLLSLTVLALVTASAVIELEPVELPFGLDLADILSDADLQASNPDPALPLWIALPVLGAFTLWLLPKIADWFFVRVGRGRRQRFVFTLAAMAAGATVALLGGIEGLIGAFLAGLGMNRLVPARGGLMDRVEFVGSTIFIPAFLVSIGLSIDPAALIDVDTVLLGLVFTAFVVVGKSTAAIATGLRFGFSWNEIGLMSSLSFGQAASTLAIAQVGLSLGMFDQIVVNAAVLAIVATALVTSYVTRFFIARVPLPDTTTPPLGSLVMLDVRPRGSSIHALMDFATALVRSDDGLVVPYAVPGPGERDAADQIVADAVSSAAEHGLDADAVVRIDDSFIDATLHLAEQTDASLLLLAWEGPRFANDYVFGSDIDRVGSASPVPTAAARILRPWRRVVVTLGSPTSAWQRDDADRVLRVLESLARAGPEQITIATSDPGLVDGRIPADVPTELITDISRRTTLIDSIEPDDLLILPAYVVHDLTPVTGWRVARTLTDANVVVIAGPHRLVTARGSQRPMSSIVR